MDIKVDELKENEDGIKGGKITIITKAHTITINSQYVDDAYYLTSNLEDCAQEISVIENTEPTEKFRIEDIDGCEFVKSKTIGNMMISLDQDMDGFYTGAIYVVYADGSGVTISPEEAQRLIDSKEWEVFQI